MNLSIICALCVPFAICEQRACVYVCAWIDHCVKIFSSEFVFAVEGFFFSHINSTLPFAHSLSRVKTLNARWLNMFAIQLVDLSYLRWISEPNSNTKQQQKTTKTVSQANANNAVYAYLHTQRLLVEHSYVCVCVCTYVCVCVLLYSFPPRERVGGFQFITPKKSAVYSHETLNTFGHFLRLNLSMNLPIHFFFSQNCCCCCKCVA